MAQARFSDPTSDGTPSRLNCILGYCLNSSRLLGPQTRLQRHGSIDLYDSQPFPGGLFSISKVRLSNSISPFSQDPSLQTSRPYPTLRNNHGPITLMLQTSHAECTFTRRPISPDFSLAPFSMVRPTRLAYAPVYPCSLRSFRSL